MVFTFLVSELDETMQCDHSLECLLLSSTSYMVLFALSVIECGNLQSVQTVLSAVAVFSPLSLFTKLNVLSQ